LFVVSALSYWLGKRDKPVLILAASDEGATVELGTQAEAAERSLLSGDVTKITVIRY
jgi:hypothetical protein